MIIDQYPIIILVYIFFAYLIAGTVKGSIGFGLPTVSISLLSFIIDVKEVIGLVLLPTLLINIYQLSQGGFFTALIKQTKFFLIFSTLFVYPGVYLLKVFQSELVLISVATVLILNSSLSLFNITYRLKSASSPYTQSILGAMNGIVIGLTSIYTMPLVFLLQSFNFNKNQTIQLLGIAFFLYPVAQFISFSNFDLINMQIFINSIIILVPIFIGVLIGQYIRGFISEVFFRKIFYLMLLFMSCIIIFNLI